MLINATGHNVEIYRHGVHVRTIPQSDILARLQWTDERMGDIDGVPIIKRTWGEVTGLPEPQAGRFYIVSNLCRQASGRLDLLTPLGMEHDESGAVIGCHALGVK